MQEERNRSGPLKRIQPTRAFWSGRFLQRMAGVSLVPDAEVRTQEGVVLAVSEFKHPTTLGMLLEFVTDSAQNLRERAGTWLRAFPPQDSNDGVYGALTQVLSRQNS